MFSGLNAGKMENTIFILNMMIVLINWLKIFY